MIRACFLQKHRFGCLGKEHSFLKKHSSRISFNINTINELITKTRRNYGVSLSEIGIGCDCIYEGVIHLTPRKLWRNLLMNEKKSKHAYDTLNELFDEDTDENRIREIQGWVSKSIDDEDVDSSLQKIFNETVYYKPDPDSSARQTVEKVRKKRSRKRPNGSGN